MMNNPIEEHIPTRRKLANALLDIDKVLCLNLYTKALKRKTTKGQLLFWLKKYAPELTEQDFDPNQDFTQPYQGISWKTIQVLKNIGIETPSSWKRTPRTITSNTESYANTSFKDYTNNTDRYVWMAWMQLLRPSKVDRQELTKRAIHIATKPPFSTKVDARLISYSVLRVMWTLKFLHENYFCPFCKKELPFMEEMTERLGVKPVIERVIKKDAFEVYRSRRIKCVSIPFRGHRSVWKPSAKYKPSEQALQKRAKKRRLEKAYARTAARSPETVGILFKHLKVRDASSK